MQEVLRVENLTVRIGSSNPLEAVTDVSFTLTKGECFALVGESGCGKSLTALSLMRLLPEGVHAQSGKVILSGTNLMALTEGEMQSVRGPKSR